MDLWKARSALQSGQRLENYRIGLSPKSLMVMNLPDYSHWDETTCDQPVCQHPQCWASVRRIERGHPRIMRAPGRPVEPKDKLPVLTIVNVSDSGLQAKRLAHPQLSHLPFRKTCSSLSQGSKIKSKHPSRPQSLPDDNAMDQIKFPKLSILNLNGTELPCSQVARNMVVVWIPKDGEKKESSAKETPAFWNRKKAKIKSEGESWPPLLLARGLKSPVATAPPPSSPVRMFEKWTPESTLDRVPQDLLKESLLPDVDKDVPCPEMKIQLAMMKKNLPLEKTRPDSAISSKMFLSVHRLTLQRRSFQQFEHLKKSRKKEDFVKKQLPQVQNQRRYQQWPQKWKVKSPAKKQKGRKLAKLRDLQTLEESEKEDKSDTGDHKISSHIIPQDWESDLKLEQMEKRGASRLESIAHPMLEISDYSDYFSSMESIELSDVEFSQREYSPEEQETEYFPAGPSPREQEIQQWYEESSPMKQETEYSHREATPMEQDVSEVPVADQETTVTHFSESPSEHCWNPELKLLRIIQATAEEEEANQASLPPSEESVGI